MDCAKAAAAVCKERERENVSTIPAGLVGVCFGDGRGNRSFRWPSARDVLPDGPVKVVWRLVYDCDVVMEVGGCPSIMMSSCLPVEKDPGVRSYSLCSKTPTADLPHPEHTTLFDDRRYTKKHAEQCKLSGDEYDRTSLQSVAYYVITM